MVTDPAQSLFTLLLNRGLFLLKYGINLFVTEGVSGSIWFFIILFHLKMLYKRC